MRQCESIRYTNSRGASIELGCTKQCELWWMDADGLDSLATEISSSGGVGQYGVTITSTKLPARSITLDGKIRTREAYWRQQLSRVFNPTLAGSLVYTDSERGVNRYLECRVATAPAVANKPWPSFQLELFAPYPLWVDGTGAQRVTDIAQWLPGIWFPQEGFCIPPEGYEMGTRSKSLIVSVPNEGDVDSGLRFVFRAQGEVVKPRIINVDTQEFLAVSLTMEAGEVLTVTTGYDNMTAHIDRQGIDSNVFSAVDEASTWLTLYVGDNLFRYSAESGEDNLNVSVYYDFAYMGARS